MTDAEFARAFETCELPPDNFHHRDHIRLAWIFLQRYGAEAGAQIAISIRRYAAHLGKSDKYHETVTQAWMRLVAAAGATSFEALTEAHPELLDKAFLNEFYSDAALQSAAAREKFVEPDRKPLPEIGIVSAGMLK